MSGASLNTQQPAEHNSVPGGGRVHAERRWRDAGQTTPLHPVVRCKNQTGGMRAAASGTRSGGNASPTRWEVGPHRDPSRAHGAARAAPRGLPAAGTSGTVQFVKVCGCTQGKSATGSVLSAAERACCAARRLQPTRPRGSRRRNARHARRLQSKPRRQCVREGKFYG